ncbi:NAD(P)H-binding protein [Saccharomonospora azurea]|uniref:NAD(P)H-binding protein n=1 Tax=Saccharomonospora azurea TaxID=40988 RepID=UPI003D93FDDC
MRVLLTGGTGYIGAAVLDRLGSGGHQVTALVRSAEKAELVRAKGAEPPRRTP